MKTSDVRHPTILLVEDLDWLRYSIKKSVRAYGYRVVEAADDAEAVEVCEREAPELILTEEEVPTFEALMARLREHPTLSSIPVVIINPDAEDGARHGDAILLTDYDRIASLLTGTRG